MVKLWDVATGKELRTLSGHTNVVNSVAFSPDGKSIASSGSNDHTIKIWDANSGKELRTLAGHSEGMNVVGFSPNGRTIVSGTWNDTIKVWDAATGQVSPPIGTWTQNHGVQSIDLSNDAGTVVAGSWDPAVRVYDVSKREELRLFTIENTDNVGNMSVAFSPDAKTFASADWNQTIKLVDVVSGKELRSFTGHQVAINSVAFSPDGKIIASGGAEGVIKLWDVGTGQELRTLKGHTDSVNAITFSPDSSLIFSGSDDKLVKVWQVATGRELYTLRGHSDTIKTVAVSSSGTIASAGLDKTIRIWDGRTGREVRTIHGPVEGFSSIAFSPNGKVIVTANNGDVKTRLWDVNTGTELASLIALDRTDWLVITPDGLFDGSPSAWNGVLWRYENNTFNVAPIEWFFNEFYYPNLLSDILSGRRPRAPGIIEQKDRRQPQIKIATAYPPATAGDKRMLKVTIEVTDAAPDKDHRNGSGAMDLRLFRNGSLVKVWHGDVLKGQPKATLEAELPIIAGANNLMAYAFNRDNVKSKNASLTVTGADSLSRKGTAYVLAIGINRYANSRYDLRYAVADAQDFSGEVKRQQELLKRYAQVEIISLSDSQATKANIEEKLSQLSARVQPEDAVIVYFAGHGTAHGNQFYLIPHDLGYNGLRDKLNEAGLQAILAHSISDRELEKIFEGIDAGQLLLVIDACNSGQALEAEEKRRGPMNSKGLAQLAYEKGMYVLTAAQSYQAAQEAAKFGHGFLTYALVEEGLKQGAADREPKNGSIDLREWLNYATEEVPRMQEQNMLEALRGRGRDIPFAQGEGDVKDPSKRSVQRPRIFYRRELELQPLVVGMVGAAPRQ